MRLEGKVAFISGGARGIGGAIAKLFASEGASVVIGDIRERDGIQTENQIQQAGGEVRFVHMDVRSNSQWRHAIGTALSRYGKLDVLVNNAGISRSGTVEDMPVETWDEIMSINNRGMFFGVKEAIPQMRKAGGGSIINISSQFGIVGTDIADPAYVASKGAVTLFTKALAVQYAKENIRVNSLHPGPIKTPANEYLSDPERLSRVLPLVPMGRVGEVEEVAYAALYLASDESSFVTGAELLVDGGWTAI